MTDLIDDILTAYGEGDTAKALRLVMPRPICCYDDLKSNHRLFPFVVNYLDACVFGSREEAYYANLCLHSLLSRDILLASRHVRSIHRLVTERDTLDILLGIKAGTVTHQPPLSQLWHSFKERRPSFAALFGKDFAPPWYALHYPSDTPPKSTPLLFLEPIDVDWSTLLTPLRGRPAILVVATKALLAQMLQFPEVFEALCDPNHLIYVLELYPNSQIAAQDSRHQLRQPQLTSDQNTLMVEALASCLAQPDERLAGDSEEGNWLYQISKRLLFSQREQRLGLSRAPALAEKQLLNQWHDRHKGLAPAGKDLGPPPEDLMGKKLRQMSHERRLRTPKIKLAHVVPQIIDEGHAPSHLLETLVKNHNSELMELMIICTERLQFHPMEYPYALPNSPPTQERAPKLLADFQAMGIKTHILGNHLTFEQAAKETASLLHQARADVAIFHGPDAIHNMCTQITDTPLRVLFDHGTPPSYPGYDLFIASSKGALQVYADLFAKLGLDAVALPYAVDLRALWYSKPPTKKNLGLPEDCLAMTTISNQLNNRLGNDMCLAIAEILQRIPRAIYAPMGGVSRQAELKAFFKKQGVDDRVIFLGAMAVPTQQARAMQLYLNEFPFGSGLGVLDAMASGCPVVTMYDIHGPPQARYGGEYMGIERAITSCKREDYVALACQLLTHPEMYQEWSEHTKRQYEQHADVKAYVKNFEEIVLSRL